MKKYIQCIVYIMFILAFSCSLDGVSVGQTGSSQTASASPEQLCDITVSIILPDYDLIAESRAIAPQTYDIVLEYSNTKSGWNVVGSPVRLSAATKEPIDNMPSGFPGSKVTLSFGGLPLRNYEAGTLKISLRDSSQKVITSGTNTQTVRGEYGKSVSATFYTVPKNTNGMSGSLNAGEMKFGSVSLSGSKEYVAKVKGTGSNYPDLVLFNENGAFYKYVPVSGDSSGETEATFTVDSTHKFYLGIWAKNAAIASYAVMISDTNALFSEDFESTANETYNNWQTVSCTKPPVYMNASDNPDYVHGGEKALYFNGEKGQTSAKQFTITLPQDGQMSFWYMCRMNAQTSGNITAYFSVIIDKEESKLMNTGTVWKQYLIKMKAGTHTVKFMTTNSYQQYSSGLNGAILDDITIQAIPSEPEFFDDFESGSLNSLFWSVNNSYYVSIANQTIGDFWYTKGVHAGLLHDPHDGKSLMINNSGIATLEGINLPSAGALTFWYKAHCTTANSFLVNIDNRDYTVSNLGLYRRWQKYTIPLTAGSHTIQFKTADPHDTNSKFRDDPGYIKVYIDDVSVALDTVESVEITPRGKQQTYIGGHTIAYTANALRSDGSVISGKTATWSVSGGGTISSSGVFTPSSAGTFTVTAAIGNKNATAEVIVHRSNTSDPITIGNNTFTGPKNDTATGNNLTSPSGFTFDTSIMPAKTTYNADGYIIIAGTLSSSWDRLYIYTGFVDRGSDGSVDFTEHYYLIPDSNGYINERIWLRHGPGDYEFDLYPCKVETYASTDSYNNINRGKPEIKKRTYTNMIGAYLYITNDSAVSADYAMWVMPSFQVESGNYRLQNAAEDIIGALPENASPEDKLKAIYDWESDLLYYDFTSSDLNDARNFPLYRRSQHSLDVFDAGCGVCEGYANLFAALTRYVGFRTKVMDSAVYGHAWNQVLFNNDWLTVDVTQADQGTVGSSQYERLTNQDKDPGSGYYDCFMLDHGKHKMYGRHPEMLNASGVFVDEYGLISRGGSEDSNVELTCY